MALQITRRDLDQAHAYARDALRTARDARRGGAMSSLGPNLRDGAVRILETGAGAVANGVLTGRFGPLHYKGNPVPLDLAAAITMHLVSFMGFAGAAAPHVHNIADGVMAGYLTKFGVGLGTKMRSDAKLPALNLTTIAGDDGSSMIGAQAPAQLYGGKPMAPLTQAELAAMANAVR